MQLPAKTNRPRITAVTDFIMTERYIANLAAEIGFFLDQGNKCIKNYNHLLCHSSDIVGSEKPNSACY